jgi:integrase
VTPKPAPFLGLRKGEICGLKRTDLSDGVLTLQRQRNWIDGEKSRLKQRGEGEVRRIGLPQEIIDRLLSIEMSNGISSSSRIQTIWRWNRFMPNFT